MILNDECNPIISQFPHITPALLLLPKNLHSLKQSEISSVDSVLIISDAELGVYWVTVLSLFVLAVGVYELQGWEGKDAAVS